MQLHMIRALVKTEIPQKAKMKTSLKQEVNLDFRFHPTAKDHTPRIPSAPPTFVQMWSLLALKGQYGNSKITNYCLKRAVTQSVVQL